MPVDVRGPASGARPVLAPTFPQLVSLELFASAVALGSMSRAAAERGITQPSASARIRQLERQLGLQLLERSPSGSVPTAAGVLVAEWTEALLAAADRLALGVAALKRDGEANVTIAASYTVAEQLLPAWLAAVQHEHPGVGIELEVVNSAGVLDRIRRSKAAIGFIESPAPVHGLASATIGGDALVVVVWPTHPWARRDGRAVSMGELVATSLVVREVGSGTREALQSAVAGAGAAVGAVPIAALGSNAAVRAAVLAEAGPAVLSGLAVETDLASGRLVAVTVAGISLERTLRAVWRRDRPLGAVAAALLTRARATAGD